MSLKRAIIDWASLTLCHLRSRRQHHLRSSQGEVKLNLGSGLAVAPGWINIDASLNSLVGSLPRMAIPICYRLSGANKYYSFREYSIGVGQHEFVHHDLTRGIPLRTSTVDYIYSSHFLEHLSCGQAAFLAGEMYRVLKSRGVARVVVPDLEHAFALYASGDKVEMLGRYFFVEVDGSSLSRHRYMYDFGLLEDLLRNAGFATVSRRCCGQGVTPDLAMLESAPKESLFVEATK